MNCLNHKKVETSNDNFKSSDKSIFYNFFYNFFYIFVFIYMKMSKYLSATYYQENKERLQK